MEDLIAAGALFVMGIVFAVLGFFTIGGALILLAAAFTFLLSIGVFIYHFFKKEETLKEMPASNRSFSLSQSKEVITNNKTNR
ncbi:hypothetical protein K8R43_00350 [archaeon]|nr:hypothetical protein [archaeon]